MFLEIITSYFLIWLYQKNLIQIINFNFLTTNGFPAPTFNDLAPFASFTDPYSFWSGNTALMPTLTDALQANYQFKKKYLLSLQAGFDKNAITWLVTLDPETNRQNVFIANTDQTNTYSLNLTIPISVSTWWEMENTLATIWQQNSTLYNDINLYFNGRSARFNTTQYFKLPYHLNLEVSAFYQSRAVYGIFRQSNTGSLNMGIQTRRKEIDIVRLGNGFYILRLRGLVGHLKFKTFKPGTVTGNHSRMNSAAILA